MADPGNDDSVSEDQWLYGDSNPDQTNGNIEVDSSQNIESFINPDGPLGGEPEPPGVLEPPVVPPHGIEQNGDAEQVQQGEEGNLQIDEGQGAHAALENGGTMAQGEGGEFDDDDDSEDDTVNVVIGDIRTAPIQPYSSLNIKRGGLLTSASGPPQLKQPGKFSIEEFEQIGTINGMAAHEYNLDSLEEKPWRKPGADITDYFNYGFNEDTWRAYCERQKRMRIHESGVGLGPLSNNVTAPLAAPRALPQHQLMDPQQQYLVPPGPPPPIRRNPGCIDVIGGQSLPTRRTTDSPPKENVIQFHDHHHHRRHSGYVMTADRREYSRKGFPDMMVPPPGGVTVPPPGFPPDIPPPHLAGAPPGFAGAYGSEFYSAEVDPYYAYEPTQDSQWSSTQVLDKVIKQEPLDPDIKDEDRPRDRERDRERDRDRDRDRDRHRDRERHRHRSRSRSTERRSRKHKSRSRSPGHRSHKKKKSKKSDRQKEEASD